MTIPEVKGTAPQDYLQSPAWQSLPPAEQTILLESLSTNELNILYPPTLQSLPAPNDLSLRDFFDAIVSTLRAFAEQLVATELAHDLQSKASVPNGGALMTVADLYEAYLKALAQVDTNTNQDINTLSTTLSNSQTLVNDENTRINEINSGNSTDQSKASALINSYNNLVSKIISQGGTETFPGSQTWNIPAGASAGATNAKLAILTPAATDYINKAFDMNDYASGRNDYINGRNSGTNTYNSTVTSVNTVLTDLQNNTNVDLSAYLMTKAGVVTSTVAGTYIPNNIGSLPQSGLVLYSPPASDYSIAANGAQHINNIPSYTPPSAQQLNDIKKLIYKSYFKKLVDPILAAFEKAVNVAQFQTGMSVFNPLISLETESPLLNNKAILKKIFGDAYTDPANPKTGGGGKAISGLTIQGALSSSHLGGILAMAIVAETLNNANLQGLEVQLQNATTQQQKDQILSAIKLIALSLLGANASKALLPGLGPLANVIGTLPPNSPLFEALFAVSFTNRVVENAGGTLAALQDLIAQNPALAGLSASDQQALAAAINLGQLLVAGKLLGASLGFPELSLLLLLTSLPEKTAATILDQALHEQSQASAASEKQLILDLTAKGYDAQTAKFLAHFAVDAVNQGLPLAPTLQSVSTANVAKQTLIDSIAAGLLVQGKGRSLNEALNIASSAVAAAIEIHKENVGSIRASIELSLRSQGIITNASDIANLAIIVADTDHNLSAKDKINNLKTLLSSHGGDHEVKTAELLALIKKLIAQLLSGQLNPALASGISDQVNAALVGGNVELNPKTKQDAVLYGTPNPDSADKENVKKPMSLINAVKKQVEVLKKTHNEKHTEKTHEAFKESIKETFDLNALYEKIISPAHTLVHSIGTGITHGGRETSNWKKSVDIQV